MNDDIVSDALTVEQIIDELNKARLAWVGAIHPDLKGKKKIAFKDSEYIAIAILTGHLLGIRYADSRGKKLVTQALRSRMTEKPERT